MGSRRGVENVKESAVDMPSFVSSIGAADNNMHNSRISDFGVLEQSMGFRLEDVADLSRNPLVQDVASDPLQFGSFTKQLASTDITSTAGRVGSVTLAQLRGPQSNIVSIPGNFESWGESAMADGSPMTDTSTDVDTDEKNQLVWKR